MCVRVAVCVCAAAVESSIGCDTCKFNWFNARA